MRVNVDFEFMEKPSKGLRNEDKVWGNGQITGELDKLPETPEEWKAISRDIAINGDYHTVAVTRILPLDEIIKLTEAAIEGEVVSD